MLHFLQLVVQHPCRQARDKLFAFAELQSRKRQSSTSTGRFEKGAGSGGQGKQCEPSFKDVCLLPSPNWGTVPRVRLKAKANLIEKSLYIDAWSFQKTYQETQLRAAISSLFHERLVDNHGNEVG